MARPSRFIDLHQDLLPHIDRRETFRNTWQTNWTLLDESLTQLLLATAFPKLDADEDVLAPWALDRMEELIRRYGTEAPDWTVVRDAADIRRLAENPDERGLIIHIEGLNPVDDSSFRRLETWYDMGWRSVGLVWNLTNSLGGGTRDPAQGLTPLGHRVVSWLEARGLIIDCAHMNVPTFWDTARATAGPLLVSHSAARAVCDHPRNCDDEQLDEIAARDGLIGVMFSGPAIKYGDRPTVADVVDHIEYICERIGSRHVGIGTDFGGIVNGTVLGLESLDQLDRLWEELSARGCGVDDLESIAWKNASRVLTDVMDRMS